MIVDGRAIARDMLREVRNMISHASTRPHLTVLTCAPNFETRKYLALKRRRAIDAGIGINVIEFPETVTTDEMIVSLRHATMQTDGVIVQLPLPKHIDTDAVLASIPQGCDADGLNYSGDEHELLPPVVGAIAEIAARHRVPFLGAATVVVGNGRLVGKPAALFATRMGANVSVVTRETENADELIRSADILILGAGSPGLITPDRIREGVIIFDAGTSEAGGLLVGDADPSCDAKAALITPVPGGIGPITVAILLRNVAALAMKAARV